MEASIREKGVSMRLRERAGRKVAGWVAAKWPDGCFSDPRGMVDTSGRDGRRNEVFSPDMEEGDAGVRELQVGNADRSDDLRFGEEIQGLLLL